MGINKEDLHKDLIGIFESAESLEKQNKYNIGTILSQIKSAITSKHQGFLTLNQLLDVSQTDKKELIELVRAYGFDKVSKAMLIAGIEAS